MRSKIVGVGGEEQKFASRTGRACMMKTILGKLEIEKVDANGLQKKLKKGIHREKFHSVSQFTHRHPCMHLDSEGKQDMMEGLRQPRVCIKEGRLAA